MAETELRRIFALVAVLALLTGSLLAGHRYFYCAAMSRIASADCCAKPDADHADARAAVTIDAPPHRCCDERTFDGGDLGHERTAISLRSVSPPALALPCAFVGAGARRPVLECALPSEAYDSRAGPPRAGPLAWRTTIDVSLS